MGNTMQKLDATIKSASKTRFLSRYDNKRFINRHINVVYKPNGDITIVHLGLCFSCELIETQLLAANRYKIAVYGIGDDALLGEYYASSTSQGVILADIPNTGKQNTLNREYISNILGKYLVN